jgi:uncharacterized Rmd1/YagE family protein
VVSMIGRTKYLPEQLATQGKITLSDKDMGRLMGEVWVEKNDVNLHRYSKPA